MNARVRVEVEWLIALSEAGFEELPRISESGQAFLRGLYENFSLEDCEAVKTIGTIGAGLFGANSAHPVANPSAGVNFAASVGMLLIPVALTHTFGKLTGDPKEGRSLRWAMWLLFALALFSFCLLYTSPSPRDA